MAHTNGALPLTTAQIDEAIVRMTKSRDTHISWMEHYRLHPGLEDQPHARSHREAVGDVRFHAEVCLGYEQVLATLRAAKALLPAAKRNRRKRAGRR
jgi:hypothetical protein